MDGWMDGWKKKVDKLVLDFDMKTKEELVSVHKKLIECLKPHQVQGIQFMWDACFESLERIKTTSGSRCIIIIAHSMGLGKTLQIIALTHTLLTHEATGIKTVLIICPLSTILNWVHEYNKWLDTIDDKISVYEIRKYKRNIERKYQLERWHRTGGVLIMSYTMFRNLIGPSKTIGPDIKKALLECLIDPGADLIVCDEGHLLKNENTALSKCMTQVKTKRRIVLTGTPLQNNLKEYHCMVQFVKPNILGTKSEFLKRFVKPITKGQFYNSTPYDVKLMKKHAHVLHRILEGSVQRFNYSLLASFLPEKQEYVIFVRLTDVQIKMYKYYLENLARRQVSERGSFFADFQALKRIWTHPLVLKLHIEKINEEKESSSEESEDKRINDNDVQAINDVKDSTNVSKHKTKNISNENEPEPLPKEDIPELEWWLQFVQSEHIEDMRMSYKLLLLFGILKECEQIGDKVLVFSESLNCLTLIEKFLSKIGNESQENESLDTLDNYTGSWSLGVDYFRLDGKTSPENRSLFCTIFNNPSHTRARLYLISTQAGGLGINVTAANRVIIFDASWNPSHDVQNLGKTNHVIYIVSLRRERWKKIYYRQVTKLSLSCRVVDEQQIERHYSNHNLNELYNMFDSYDEARSTLSLPKDKLLAEIFLKYMHIVENYHEHDSLLENKAEEELDEEERKQAWLEYDI